MKQIQCAADENRLMAGTLFAFFVSGAASLALGSLIPFLRETYQLSYDFAGMLLSLQSVGNLVAILLMGYLPALLGRRKSVLLTAVWMAAAYLLFSTGIGGAALLPAACLMTGIAKGGNANFSNTMMSTLPGKKAAIGYNLLHGAFAAGALLSPLAVIACTRANPSGWRYMTMGVLGLCIAQIVVYSRVPLPQEPKKGSAKAVDYGFVKSRSFWLASAILFFYISAEYAITGWMVTYFQDIGVLAANLSQLMSSLLWVVMFAGRMVGAVIVGKVSRKLLLVVDGAGLLGFFLLVFFSRSQTPIFLGIMGVGLFMATIYPSALALGTQSVRGNDLGVSSMILAGSIGGIAAPAAVGLVAERAGIHAGMGVVVVVTVLLMLTILLSVWMKEDTQ